MSVTLKQIADEVGVSQSLVTFALNGKSGVSDSRRQEIVAAAERMGYNPQANRAARVLIARRHGTLVRTGVLALLLPTFSPAANASGGMEENSDSQSVQEHPFYMPYFWGVEIEAARRKYNLFVCAMREDGLPALIDIGGVDGVIGIGVDAAFELLRARNIPALSLGFAEPDTACLVPDDAAGVRQAVAHLVGRGHTRIAYLGFAENAMKPARVRLRAYRSALKAHGLSTDAALVEATTWKMERKEGATLLDKLLARGEFTALLCYNDLLAMGALDRLKQLKKRVPKDMAVVGFDGYAAQIGFRPALTSASFDRQQMGRRAVAMLCEYLDDARTPGAREEAFPVQLIQGETT